MNKEKCPLVSIGLTTYQSEDRIECVLRALLAQTYPNFEVIISDDASSDRTQSVCEELSKDDSRIIYIRQPKNIGRVYNFIFTAKESKGKYFLWAADDDWWDKTFIEELVSGLEAYPLHGVALSSYARVYSDGSIRDVIEMQGERDLTRQSFYHVYKRIAGGEPLHNFICGIWRKDFLLALLKRRPAHVMGWDRIFMAEAALATHFYSVRPMLFRKTINPIPYRRRHAVNAEQQWHAARFGYHWYLFMFLWRLVTSRLIPMRRKFLIPIPWLSLVWSQRKRIFFVFLRDWKRS